MDTEAGASVDEDNYSKMLDFMDSGRRGKPSTKRRQMYRCKNNISNIKHMMNEKKRKMTLARASLPKGRYILNSRSKTTKKTKDGKGKRKQGTDGNGDTSKVCSGSDRSRVAISSILHQMGAKTIPVEEFHLVYEPLLRNACEKLKDWVKSSVLLSDLSSGLEDIRICFSKVQYNALSKSTATLLSGGFKNNRKEFREPNFNKIERIYINLEDSKEKKSILSLPSECSAAYKEVQNLLINGSKMFDIYQDNLCWYRVATASAEEKIKEFQTALDQTIKEYGIYKKEIKQMREEDDHAQLIRLKDLHIKLNYDNAAREHNERKSNHRTGSSSHTLKQASLISFFSTGTLDLGSKVRRMFHDFYYNDVVGAKNRVTFFDVEKELKKMVQNHCKKACPDWYKEKLSKKRQAVHSVSMNMNKSCSEETIGIECQGCGSTKVVLDSVTKYYTCTECGQNFAGMGNLAVGYKCAQQFSMKPYAEYQRLSHVSIYTFGCIVSVFWSCVFFMLRRCLRVQ